jgi:hypothetical protein
MRVHFEKVGFVYTKTGKCSVCGKRCTERKEFYQTLNPWNRMPDGTAKTEKQIRAEEEAKAAEWKRAPLTHKKCRRPTP